MKFDGNYEELPKFRLQRSHKWVEINCVGAFSREISSILVQVKEEPS